MAKENGSRFKLSVMLGTTTLVKTLITEQLSLTIDKETKTIDVTSKDNGGYEEFIAGLKSGQSEVEFILDLSPATGKANHADLSAIEASGAIKSFVAEYVTAAAKTMSYTFNALITNLNLSAPMEDKMTVKCTLKRSGAPTETVV